MSMDLVSGLDFGTLMQYSRRLLQGFRSSHFDSILTAWKPRNSYILMVVQSYMNYPIVVATAKCSVDNGMPYKWGRVRGGMFLIDIEKVTSC